MPLAFLAVAAAASAFAWTRTAGLLLLSRIRAPARKFRECALSELRVALPEDRLRDSVPPKAKLELWQALEASYIEAQRNYVARTKLASVRRGHELEKEYSKPS